LLCAPTRWSIPARPCSSTWSARRSPPRPTKKRISMERKTMNGHVGGDPHTSCPGDVGLESLLDLEKGRMSRLVFQHPGLYERELERIFARCWLFVAHESQI